MPESQMSNAGVHDVVVIGAGPAGLLAAQELAARGHDVLVLEEHPTVGLPVHCTGVIGRDAFDELDLPRDTILGFTRAASFRAPDGLSVLVESNHVVAAVIDRGRFDARLAARAIEIGAQLETAVRVRRVEVHDRAVEIRTVDRGRAYRARACVIACGATYRFNRDLGLGVPRTFLHSAQVEMPFPDMPHVEVQLGRDIAPAGFAWTVPFRRDGRSHARLGVMCVGHSRARFQAYAAASASRRGVGPSDIPPPRLKILPLGPVSRTYGTRVVAVGDAAGLVKPTTGGGIYYGLLSGRLAADTLDGALRHDTLDARHLRVYETRWRERLGPEIRIGLAFRAIASRVSDRGVQALVELARVDGLVPLLESTADFNWHRGAALALLKNPAVRKIVLDSILR
jgi:digeranylgeranylglycerophospholipid reductase